MPVTPTGPFALAVNYAMQTLAASATFQALVGAANQAAALAFIEWGETDEHNVAQAMPRAYIDVAGENDWEKVSDTGFLANGRLEMVLEIPTPALYQGAANRRDARVWFYNNLGGILADMQALAGQAGYLNIIKFDEQNTGRADPKENDGADFWVSIWNLTYLG